MESPIDVLSRTVFGLLSSGAIGVSGRRPRRQHGQGRLRRAVDLLRRRLRRVTVSAP